MWSKLRRKVLKSEGDDKDQNGSVVLKKFDKIPSYVFEPEGDITVGLEPVDWQMALALDNVPTKAPHDSPLANGRHRASPQRPLSTFAVTYSPKLSGHRHSLSRDSEQMCYGMDLEGTPLPPCSCAGLDSDMCLSSPVHSGTPTHNVISLQPSDHARLFSDTLTDNAQEQANVANGNLGQDEGQNMITVSMGITVSMSTPTTVPKHDRKYERVVTNEQVIKEQMNSPQRRKKVDIAPVAIKERKCSEETLPSSFSSVGTTGSNSSHGLPVFSTSSAGSVDHMMLPSEPSTANSDNVFELEVQFERQESGYATLDDGPMTVSPAADTTHVMSTMAPVMPTIHCTTITTVASIHSVDKPTGVLSNNHSPTSPDNRIYPTFRKQLGSGNNNTTSTPTPAVSQQSGASNDSNSKSNNVDINQNLQNQNGDSTRESQQGASSSVHDSSTQEPALPQLQEYFPDPPNTLRERVEYVPADSSVSRIYRKSGDSRRGGDDDLGSSVEDLYASVPKGTQRQSTDEGTATATSSDSSRSSSKVDEIEREEDSIGGESEAATEKTDETSGTLVGSDQIVDDLDDEPDDGIDLDIDTDNDDDDDDIGSEDNEVVPPIPEKNYKLINEGTIMKEVVGKRAKGSLSSENDEELLCEPTHMSWDEVMTEARNLGIPWTKPASMSVSLTETSPRRCSNDMDRSCDHCDSVSITSLEISSPHPSPAITNTRKQQLANESKPDKKRSPFKDKFKFHSLFSSKKNKNSSETCNGHNGHKFFTMVGHQKRNASAHKTTVTTANCTVCSTTSPRSSKSTSSSGSGLKVKIPPSPGTPASGRSSAITLPRDISGSTASWGSSSSIQSRSVGGLSVSHSNTSLNSASHASSPCSTNNIMSHSMTSAIPAAYSHSTGGSSIGGSSSLGNGSLSPSTPTRNSNADFIDSLWKLKDCGWYWGPMNWDDAETKLSSKPDGSFLVRDSSDDRYILSLSFRSQGSTHHTRIEHYKGMFSFYSQPKSHGAATIVEFIEKAMEHSRSGKFLYFLRPRAPGLPPAPVQLLYPVSRFRNMHSLQHLCRFQILKHTRKDLIDRLPIPPRLKEYLKQSQYYTEYYADDIITREHAMFHRY